MDLFLQNEFYDIHCHILPGLDDGAPDLEESLRMLQLAKADGIVGIVATPHIMDGVYDNTKEIVVESVTKLREKTNGIPLYIGADIRISRGLLHRVENRELPLINDKTYILLELPTYSLPPISALVNIVNSLKMEKITPIITHPERNVVLLDNFKIMEELIQHGAIFQVTAMSIMNKFGRGVQRAALEMIKEGYVHAVASDAHDTRNRPPILSEAYTEILKKFGESEARRLFTHNPLKIIKGEQVS